MVLYLQKGKVRKYGSYLFDYLKMFKRWVGDISNIFTVYVYNVTSVNSNVKQTDMYFTSRFASLPSHSRPLIPPPIQKTFLAHACFALE